MKYVPASSFAILNLTENNHRRIMEKYQKTCNWWEEPAFFRHKYLLISAYHGLQYPDFRKKFRIPKEVELMGDSGGFSQYSGSLQLDNIEILRWQEKNCDIGFSLDYPLVVNDNLVDVEIKNKHNIKNIKEAIEERKNNMKYYACIHGWNKKQVLDVHKELPDEGIDGWGIGECSATDDSPEGIIKRIALEISLNKEKKPMHILGCCSPIMIAFFSLIEKKEGITISYDSTAYSNGAMYRWYHLDGFKRDKLKVNAEYNGGLPCNCPICKVADVEDMKGADSEAGTLISLHNLYHEKELNKQIEELDGDFEKLKDFIWKGYGKKSRYSRFFDKHKLFREFYKKSIDQFVKDYPYYNNKFLCNRNLSIENILEKKLRESIAISDIIHNKKPKPKINKEVQVYDIVDEDWN